MMQVAITELCKFLSDDVGTIPRLYVQLLSGRGYIKDPVYDEHGLLTGVTLGIECRNLKRVRDALRDGEINKKAKEARYKENAAAKEARRIMRERRKMEATKKKLGGRGL